MNKNDSKYTTVTFSITLDNKRKLDKYCDENMLNRSKLFQRLLENHLKLVAKKTSDQSFNN
jgi:hypothetical protein